MASQWEIESLPLLMEEAINSRNNYTLPRLIEEAIENLLGEWLTSIGLSVVLPVPIEKVATDVLGYQVVTEDLRYLGDEIRGGVVTSEKRILIDSSCNYLRRRFALAHEIGHIILKHLSLVSDIRSRNTSSTIRYLPGQIETQTNRFAGALLIPWQLLIPRLIKFPKVDTQVVEPIAEEFEVSTSVALIRLLDLARDELLYTLTDKGVPTPLFIDMPSLEKLKTSIREKTAKRMIKRPPPPYPNQLGSVAFQSNNANVKRVHSESELVDFVKRLGTKEQVGIVVGGTLLMTTKEKRLLETIKNRRKFIVIICTNEEHATYLKHFGRIIDHIIVFEVKDRTGELALPPQIQDYECARVYQNDRILPQIQRDFEEEDSEKHEAGVAPWEPEDIDIINVTQPPLWAHKRLNTKKEARLYIRSAKKESKRAVLVTGCFDLLHIGHVTFLQNTKKEDEVLVVGVEDDKRVFRWKGKVINNVANRCEMLEALSCVDFVFVISDLPKWPGLKLYEHLARSLRPNFRATTDDDPHIELKRAQIEAVNGALRVISRYEHGHSTSNDFAKLLLARVSEINTWQLIESRENWITRKAPIGYSTMISYSNNRMLDKLVITKNLEKVTREYPKQLRLFQENDYDFSHEANHEREYYEFGNQLFAGREIS